MVKMIFSFLEKLNTNDTENIILLEFTYYIKRKFNKKCEICFMQKSIVK